MQKSAVKESSQEGLIDRNYRTLLKELKSKVKSAQLKAAIAVNTEMICLYWEIGKSIHLKNEEHGWGAKTVEKLSKDLRSTFPEMKGFSCRNLKYMLKFAREYPDFEIVQQLAAQIPWFHNVILLERVKKKEARLWYIKKTIEHNWSRSILETWIKTNLYNREGKGVNNFDQTIASPETDLARETLKDPYCFDFLMLRRQFTERELESGLFDHLQHFLLEMGEGFAFVGRQKHLNIGGQDFYIDMLFYNYKLRRFFVIELKATDFKPEYIGKLNFYLTAVDEVLKHPDDEPTIGLLLCKNKNKVLAEYALRNINSPMNVAEFETKIIDSLPKDLESSLPTIEEIEREFQE